MSRYICSKCNKGFKYLSKLKEHNVRKTPCFSVNKIKPSKTLKNPQKPSIYLKNPQFTSK